MENQQLSKEIKPKNLLLAALLGAFLPFALLAIIILTKEDVFETWMIFPLTIIPAGGAFGGLFFYLMGFQWFPEGNRKLIAVIGDTANAGSIGLHSAMGFVHVGTIGACGWKFDQWLDVVLMEKALGDGANSSPV